MGSIASAAGGQTESAFNIVGGIVGNQAAEGDRSKAEQAYNDAVNQIVGMRAPPDLAKEIILEKLKSAGVLNPKMEEAITAGISQVSQVAPDQTGRNAQLNALQQMQQVGKTGLRPEDMAALNQIRQQVAQDTEGKRQQIIQNYQQRGLGGGGAELAAQLQGAQSGANQSSQMGDQLASQASQRALQAIQQGGAMGGQLQGADTNLALQKANAADQFKQFDTQNAMARQQRNVTAQNQAQQANLANQQGVQNYNAQMANQEKARQLQGAQQAWEDQFALAKAKSGAQSNLSSYYTQLGNNVAKNTADTYSGMGEFFGGPAKAMGSSGGGEGGGGGDMMGMASGAMSMFSDKRMKDGITPGDHKIEHFLSNIQPYDYSFKEDPSKERHVSPMAQDLEKSEIGAKAVMNTEKGKAVDYEKLLPAIVASQGLLYKILKESKGDK